MASEVFNEIEISLETLPDKARDFISNTVTKANENGIRVRMLNVRKVPYTDDPDNVGYCNGYFCDDSKELTVSCDQEFKKWFKVFVHESSHMDQYLEDDPCWCATICGVEAYDIMELWLQHRIELSDEQLDEVIYPCMYIELDCERRALQKIISLDLPLDPQQYAQGANAYVYFYWLMKYTRVWYNVNEEPYNIESVVSNMPTDLYCHDYKSIPEDIKRIMVSGLYPERLLELCGRKE